MKLYLLAHSTLRGNMSTLKSLGPLEKSILRRLNSTVSSLSMTRYGRSTYPFAMFDAFPTDGACSCSTGWHRSRPSWPNNPSRTRRNQRQATRQNRKRALSFTHCYTRRRRYSWSSFKPSPTISIHVLASDSWDFGRGTRQQDSRTGVGSPASSRISSRTIWNGG